MKQDDLRLYKLLFVFGCSQEDALKRLGLYENIIKEEGSWSERGKISPASSYYFEGRLDRPCCLEFRERQGLPYPIERFRRVFKTGIRINLFYLDRNRRVLRSLDRLRKYDGTVLRTFLTKVDLPNSFKRDLKEGLEKRT